MEDSKKITKILLISVLCISLVANVGLVFWLVKTVDSLNGRYAKEKINYQILSFANMFVEKILMADGDVDFDTRLELETAVRSLNDTEIFNQWQSFTKSSTKTEASTEAKELIDLLLSRALKS